MASSTLETIRIKVRRLTHSPSASQITDDEIDAYINTFYQYDFPEHLRLFTNLVPVTFYTSPDVDTYETNSDALSIINQLSDFKNRFTSVHPPIYVDGMPAFYTQSPAEFYGIYPKNKQVGTITTGDGTTVITNGTLSIIPIQKGTVSFSSRDAVNNALVVADDGTGTLTGDGAGTINYLTGVYAIVWTSPPASGADINYHVFPYEASRPQAMLYYQNKFVLRPIPDDVYAVDLQAYQTFTDFASDSSNPEINQWWQYIAYGAAKKVFEDRMDNDSAMAIMPELKQQERLILRRSLTQQSNERTATIYTEGVGIDAGGLGLGPNGNNY